MNPTTDVFEQRVAALEGGVAALGVAIRPGGRDAVDPQPRPCRRQHRVVVVALRRDLQPVHAHPAQARDHDYASSMARIRRPSGARSTSNTKAVFLELIGNPRLDVHDLASIADVAHARGVPVIVDNTFAPLIAQPIKHGADIVIHSATKWIGGHGTAIGGVVVDGGTFDWAASRAVQGGLRRSGSELPRDQLRGRVREPGVHPQAAGPGPARPRGRAQPVQLRSCSCRASKRCRCGSRATARTRWPWRSGWRRDRRSPGSATRASSRTTRTSSPSAT